MMQKDELILFDAWINYYSHLFLPSNLYVFDNGSTHHLMADKLLDAEHKGVHVYKEYDTKTDFMAKGEIFADLIHHLDASDPYDFYFPLDCDEFIAVEANGKRSCERKAILEELHRYKDVKNVLTIDSKYYTTPFQKNLYRRLLYNITTKCFFAKGACVGLDHGFHQGKSVLGNEQVRTGIIYFEFHCKPYLEYRQSCREKLSGLVADFSSVSLKSYYKSRKNNFHSANELLLSKYEYLHLCQNEDYCWIEPALLDQLDQLAINYAPLYEQTNWLPRPIWILTLRLRHQASKFYMHIEQIQRLFYRFITKMNRIIKRSIRMLLLR